MNAPVPLEHVSMPPWLGEDLNEATASVAEADGLATWSDVGGLGASGLDMGVGGDATFNVTGAMGTAASQYERSLIQGKTRWEQALRAFEAAAAAFLDVQLGAIHPIVPVADQFILKRPLARLNVDFSLADTISGVVRAAAVLIVHARTGRHEELARLRARAETGGMGSLGKAFADTVNWLRQRSRGTDPT